MLCGCLMEGRSKGWVVLVAALPLSLPLPHVGMVYPCLPTPQLSYIVFLLFPIEMLHLRFTRTHSLPSSHLHGDAF